MKRTICIISLVVFAFPAFTQGNIAKLKYEQAEEAFSLSDFNTTLSKLEEVEQLLGSVNPKLMYLRIMAQSRLLPKDNTLLKSLKQNCEFYLKEYDGNNNLVDKYRDVFRVSESLMQYEDNANFLAGIKYLEEKNFDNAFAYLQKAANQGYTRSFNYMGEMYENGLGVKQNYQVAMEWYEKARNTDDAKAFYNLGHMYLKGKFVAQNNAEAQKLFGIAIGKGVPEAFEGMADVCYARKDYSTAREYYTHAAGLGSDRAMAILGDMYFYSKGVTYSVLTANEWYLKAAEKGNAYALGKAGLLNLYKGDKVSTRLGIEQLTQASDKGDATALFFMGIIHDNKMCLSKNIDFVPYIKLVQSKDEESAIRWLEKSASHGYLDAMIRLAEIHECKFGKENKIIADQWRAKASEFKNDKGRVVCESEMRKGR